MKLLMILSKILKASFLFLFIIGLMIYAYEYWMTTHTTKFKLADQYEIELFSDECGFCYLDWPIDFVIKVKEISTSQRSRYKFWMGNGPYIQFGVPNDGTKKLLIQGYKYNSPHPWIIDLEKEKIREITSMEKIDNLERDYTLLHKLNKNFEIE